MTRWITRRWMLAATLAMVGGMAGRAEATLTINGGFLSGAGPYTYNFTASTSSADQINPGDFFRIYDFAGYVPGTVVAPAGWSASVGLINPTPPPNILLAYGDDPTLTNLTFTYTATSPIVGQTTITGFAAQSIYATTTFKDFASRGSLVNGPLPTSKADSGGIVLVPMAAPLATPEPSTIALAASALPIGLFAWRRRRKAATV